MGIREGPSTSGASALFDQASEHWKHMRAAESAKDDEKKLSEIMEVIRLCQQAISADKNQGNAYVLLTSALFVSCSPRANTEMLGKYASGVIHKWRTLAEKQGLWRVPRIYEFEVNYQGLSSPGDYELGVSLYALLMACWQKGPGFFGTEKEAEASMAILGSLYGDFVTSPRSYEEVRQAVAGAVSTRLPNVAPAPTPDGVHVKETPNWEWSAYHCRKEHGAAHYAAALSEARPSAKVRFFLTHGIDILGQRTGNDPIVRKLASQKWWAPRLLKYSEFRTLSEKAHRVATELAHTDIILPQYRPYYPLAARDIIHMLEDIWQTAEITW